MVQWNCPGLNTKYLNFAIKKTRLNYTISFSTITCIDITRYLYQEHNYESIKEEFHPYPAVGGGGGLVPNISIVISKKQIFKTTH